MAVEEEKTHNSDILKEKQTKIENKKSQNQQQQQQQNTWGEWL